MEFKKRIRLVLTFIVLVFSVINTNAQFAKDNKYPYTYRLKLANFPSSCYFQVDNSKMDSKDKELYTLSFRCFNENMEPESFVTLLLISSDEDTIILRTDINGLVEKKIDFGDSFFLTISDGFHSDINVYIPTHEQEYAKKDITIVLGLSLSDTVIMLYSKKTLTLKEMSELMEDIRNQNEDSKLLKDKTCYWMIEI